MSRRAEYLRLQSEYCKLRANSSPTEKLKSDWTRLAAAWLTMATLEAEGGSLESICQAVTSSRDWLMARPLI